MARCEILGIEEEVDPSSDFNFMVVDEEFCLSIHTSLAAAKAKIRWEWRKQFPTKTLGVLNIETGELYA